MIQATVNRLTAYINSLVYDKPAKTIITGIFNADDCIVPNGVSKRGKPAEANANLGKKCVSREGHTIITSPIQMEDSAVYADNDLVNVAYYKMADDELLVFLEAVNTTIPAKIICIMPDLGGRRTHMDTAGNIHEDLHSTRLNVPEEGYYTVLLVGRGADTAVAHHTSGFGVSGCVHNNIWGENNCGHIYHIHDCAGQHISYVQDPIITRAGEVVMRTDLIQKGTLYGEIGWSVTKLLGDSNEPVYNDVICRANSGNNGTNARANGQEFINISSTATQGLEFNHEIPTYGVMYNSGGAGVEEPNWNVGVPFTGTGLCYGIEMLTSSLSMYGGDGGFGGQGGDSVCILDTDGLTVEERQAKMLTSVGKGYGASAGCVFLLSTSTASLEPVKVEGKIMSSQEYLGTDPRLISQDNPPLADPHDPSHYWNRFPYYIAGGKGVIVIASWCGIGLNP